MYANNEEKGEEGEGEEVNGSECMSASLLVGVDGDETDNYNGITPGYNNETFQRIRSNLRTNRFYSRALSRNIPALRLHQHQHLHLTQ
jgi:hypothetical protein